MTNTNCKISPIQLLYFNLTLAQLRQGHPQRRSICLVQIQRHLHHSYRPLPRGRTRDPRRLVPPAQPPPDDEFQGCHVRSPKSRKRCICRLCRFQTGSCEDHKQVSLSSPCFIPESRLTSSFPGETRYLSSQAVRLDSHTLGLRDISSQMGVGLGATVCAPILLYSTFLMRLTRPGQHRRQVLYRCCTKHLVWFSK